MAKEKYKIVRQFVGSVVHTVLDGLPVTILLDVNTDQSVLEQLFNNGYEGVVKL